MLLDCYGKSVTFDVLSGGLDVTPALQASPWRVVTRQKRIGDIQTATTTMVTRLAAVVGIVIATIAIPALAAATAPKPGSAPPSSLNGHAMHTFVDKLLKRMTLSEKVGQLTIRGKGDTGPEELKLIREGKLGGTNGMLPQEGKNLAHYIHHMQELAMQSPLKIPLWFMGDVEHGFRTTFPAQLAMAATWNPSLVEQAIHASAVEATAVGMDWTFSPMVGVTRDPRWGRVVESDGEDPYLGSVMAAARVRGFQGDNLAAPDTMMATVKHFAGYGAVQAGRDYNPVFIPKRELEDVYFPPYRAAIGAGAGAVMPTYVTVNGIPAASNHWLLTHVLRKQWGFKGVVVSDYAAIPNLQNQGVADNPAAAALDALHAGVDIDLHGSAYLDELPALVRQGKVPISEVNAAVRRVLEAKYRLGLFQNPFLYGSNKALAKRMLSSPQHLKLALKVAIESMVLLKNDGVLPLDKHGRIAVIGPLANARGPLLGPNRAMGKRKDVISMLAGIRSAVGKAAQIRYVRGVGITSDSTSGIAAAVHAAKESDVAIIVVGENTSMVGEGRSVTRLGLPGRQLELVKAISVTGTPVVVVLVNGRPLTIPWIATHVAAIMEAWEPGDEGGNALADLLFGNDNPSGKLPMTFPYDVGQVPIYYDHLPPERPWNPNIDDHGRYTSHYIDAPNAPVYPFGYGLSYTHFSFGKVHLSSNRLSRRGTLQVRVRLTNTGKRDGTEVAQLYVHQLVARVSRPVKQLKGFQRVTLKPGESRELTFTLTPAALAFHRADMSWGTVPSDYRVFVGGDSTTTNYAQFTLTGAATRH